jgi:hypothetical protein
VRETCGLCINIEELTTIQVGWEVGYKNLCSQQPNVLLPWL